MKYICILILYIQVEHVMKTNSNSDNYALIISNNSVFCRCECYDYLFDIAIQMKQCGLDPSALPVEEKGIV